jgi:hypothetical protein
MADNDETQAKCAHNACVCTAPRGEAYCSEYCEHAATSGPPRENPVCECGHPACSEHEARRT